MRARRKNVLFPFVFADATRTAADRLRRAVMALLEAVADAALAGGLPGLPEFATDFLFDRLAQLVFHLIRASNAGPQPAKPLAQPAPRVAAPRSKRAPDPDAPLVPRLPHRRGWLLAALPDLAPGIAAQLQDVLADPDLTPLLDANPSLARRLRPLLRALDLDLAAPRPPSPATPQPPPPSEPGRDRPSDASVTPSLPSASPPPTASKSLPRPGTYFRAHIVPIP